MTQATVSYYIGTAAGSGVSGTSSDGGLAQGSALKTVYAVWADTTGYLYVGEYTNYKVRTVDASGILGTFAGTGTYSTLVTGGTATSANLGLIASIWGSGGTVYILDNYHYRVVTVVNGILSYYAGSGTNGYLDGVATAANFSPATVVTGDSLSNIYILDNNNFVIRMVNSTTSIMSTIAGTYNTNGLAGDGGPATSAILSFTVGGLWHDSANTLYFGDGTTRIRAISFGFIKSVVGMSSYGTSSDGLAGTSTMIAYGVTGVWTDTQGNLFYSDSNAYKIKAWTISVDKVATAAGTGSKGSSGNYGKATAAQIGSPVAIYGQDASLVYFADYSNYMIRPLTPSQPSTPAPSVSPTFQPSVSYTPSVLPSVKPTTPTMVPTIAPSKIPSVIPTTAGPTYIPSFTPTSLDSVIFDYSGAYETLIVPTGATSMTVVVYGAGNTVFVDGTTSCYGGKGASVTASFAVTGGSTYYVYVGGQGGVPAAGFNGGAIGGVSVSSSSGGSGATDIRTSIGDLSTRIIVAGGGGGSCVHGNLCIVGGDSGQLGSSGGSYASYSGGGGGSQSAGGSLGGGCCSSAGSLGNGGAGSSIGGGGGGGYYGGGGSYNGGGGGGSSYGPSGSVFVSGVWSGNGRAIVSFNAPTALPTFAPTALPSIAPTLLPTALPTYSPTFRPSYCPSSLPSSQPSCRPSSEPTVQPSIVPSGCPSAQPFENPTCQPSGYPSSQPSDQPSGMPSRQPSTPPSAKPSMQPIVLPSGAPSTQPFAQPSRQPSGKPSLQPSVQPSGRPSRQPSGRPSVVPSNQPTLQPSSRPSSQPSGRPTRQPTARPSAKPSKQPTNQPSEQPSMQPSEQPSMQPVSKPSSHPTVQPTSRPTVQPTNQPSAAPTSVPSSRPSDHPSHQPQSSPSMQPRGQPSSLPSGQPTCSPTSQPSHVPSSRPRGTPTSQPTTSPSSSPSKNPSSKPTSQPIAVPSAQPSSRPTSQPSRQPSRQPSSIPSETPTNQPSVKPSAGPSVQPSRQPSSRPTKQPSARPSRQPSRQPSVQPSVSPTGRPSSEPSSEPTSTPSCQPSSQPSSTPTRQPSVMPSAQPSRQPSSQPSTMPSTEPTRRPSAVPSCIPTCQPSVRPSDQPTSYPSMQPSSSPIAAPSSQPSVSPTAVPSEQPTSSPTSEPSMQPTNLPSAQPSIQPSNEPTSSPTINGLNCTEGTYYSFEHNRCKECPAFSSSIEKGQISCACNGGYGATGFRDTLICDICGAGSASANQAGNCTSCPAGSFSVEGASECTTCPQGTYNSLVHQSHCVHCGVGLTTPSVGSISSAQCISPVPSFTLGFFALGFVAVVFGWYMLMGKFHRVAFKRKHFTVLPMAEKCILINNMLKDSMKRAVKKPKKLFAWQKTVLFLLVAVILVTFFSALTYTILLYHVFFTSLIVYRGIHVNFTLRPILNQIERALEAITISINIPSYSLYYLVYPMIVVFEYLSHINFSISAVNVTCQGAQAPMQLLSDCVILGIAIVFIRSDYQLFFNVTLAGLNKSFLSSNLVKGGAWKNRNILMCLFVIFLLSINPIQIVLRYALGFVSISTFTRKDHVAHQTTQACDNIRGVPKLDSILGYTATIMAWWLIIPTIYIVSEVVVTKNISRRINPGMAEEESKACDDEEGNWMEDAVNKEGKEKDSARDAVVSSLKGCDINDGKSVSESGRSTEPVTPLAKQKAFREKKSMIRKAVTSTDARMVFLGSRVLYSAVASVDLWLVYAANSWIEHLSDLSGTSKGLMTQRFVVYKGRVFSRRPRVFSVSPDGDVAVTALTRSIEKFRRSLRKGRLNRLQLLRSSFKKFEKRVLQEDAKVDSLVVEYKPFSLPNCMELCFLVQLEMTETLNQYLRVHWLSVGIAIIVTYIGVGQFVTDVGLRNWKIVANKYYLFMCVVFGVWTTAAVEAYDLTNIAKSLSVDKPKEALPQIIGESVYLEVI